MAQRKCQHSLAFDATSNVHNRGKPREFPIANRIDNRATIPRQQIANRIDNRVTIPRWIANTVTEYWYRIDNHRYTDNDLATNYEISECERRSFHWQSHPGDHWHTRSLCWRSQINPTVLRNRLIWYASLIVRRVCVSAQKDNAIAELAFHAPRTIRMYVWFVTRGLYRIYDRDVLECTVSVRERNCSLNASWRSGSSPRIRALSVLANVTSIRGTDEWSNCCVSSHLDSPQWKFRRSFRLFGHGMLSPPR